jgi:hypothetical protein
VLNVIIEVNRSLNCRYLGIARKLCLMTEPGKALWQTPDFSECISVRLDNILTKVSFNNKFK